VRLDKRRTYNIPCEVTTTIQNTDINVVKRVIEDGFVNDLFDPEFV
jgi:hypothetical protein